MIWIDLSVYNELQRAKRKSRVHDEIRRDVKQLDEGKVVAKTGRIGGNGR